MRIELLDGYADLERREVVRDGHSTPLTETEATLLAYLATHENAAIRRSVLLAEVWDYHPNSATRTLDTTVRRLRNKVEPEPKRPQLIVTAHGVGYRFQAPTRLDLGGSAATFKVAPKARIPVDVTPFFGRSEELGTLARLMEEPGNLLVLGPGGVGKSRLVRQAAHAWSLRFGAPAWWISAAEDDETETFANRVATRLQMRLPATGDRFDALGERLAKMGPLLLLFDGADDLDDEILERLSTWGGSLRILVTRRRRPGLECRVLRLHPLTGEDAERLFLDRARERFPALDADPAVLARVLGTLGGLPLAIQLAAARVRVLDLPDLAARLEQGIDVLRDHSEPGEHGAMERVLQRSWDLLKAEQRRVLLDSTVFSGPFSLELARDVLEGGEVDVLESLVDDGLLESRSTDDGVRFDMLDCVRAFLLPRTSEPNVGIARSRLSQALASRARLRLDSIFGPITSAACRWLGAHAGDYDVARKSAVSDDWIALTVASACAARKVGDERRAIALWDQLDAPLGWFHNGTATLLDIQERQQLLDRAATSTEDPRLQAAILFERARLAGHIRGDGNSLPLLEEALAAFESLEDVMGIASCCSLLLYAAAGIGELESAVRWRRRGLDTVSDTDLLIKHQLRLAPFPLPPEENPTLEDLRDTVSVARAAGIRMLLSHALVVESHRALELGLVDRALSTIRESVETVKGVHSPTTRAGVFGNAAIALRELAWFEEAHACSRALEVELGERPMPHYRLSAAINRAWCYIDQGRLENASESVASIADIATNDFERQRVIVIDAAVLALQGQPVEQIWRQAREAFGDLEAPTHLARVDVLLATQGPADADELLQEAMDLGFRHGDVSICRAAEWIWTRRGNPPRSTPDRGAADPREYLSFVRLAQRLFDL